MLKTVVFKVNSFFTLYESALIGYMEYRESFKILYLGFNIDDVFRERIINSTLFDEVVCIPQIEKNIETVERRINGFLYSYDNIDDYFMCVFSDGYSIALAHKLQGKAKIHIFPEGSSAINLRNRIDYNINYLYGENRDLIRVYDEYPIDLSLFDYLWTYDEKMEQGID